jgi:hypothetical protein
MNTDDALQFLRAHQPMPSDAQLSEEDVEQYDAVRRHFLAHPSPECVPLLLNSFGEGDGLGVYPLVEDVLRKLPKNAVVPHLRAALGSVHRSVRYWCAQIAAVCPDSFLIQPLTLLLDDSDPDIRCAAITALVQIEDGTIVPLLQSALDRESDPEVRQMLTMATEDFARKQ